jgi:hypothetical protein
VSGLARKTTEFAVTVAARDVLDARLIRRELDGQVSV